MSKTNMNYCYIIYSDNTTYNGYTVNLKRRLRQHNGELVGGARSTKSRAGSWDYLVIITCSTWTKNQAMSMEWTIRYPTRKKPRPWQYSGIEGRLASLALVFTDTDNTYDVYVNTQYVDKLPSLPNNVTIKPLHELMPLQC